MGRPLMLWPRAGRRLAHDLPYDELLWALLGLVVVRFAAATMAFAVTAEKPPPGNTCYTNGEALVITLNDKLCIS